MIDTTMCPECGQLAQVQWRAVIESTEGPIEHAKIHCVQRHWFLLPVARLAQPAPVRTVRATHPVVR